MDSLAIALPTFFGSAFFVVLAGVALARYGDELAEHTGWGHLWVGTVLVSVATSLPELVTNVSATAIGAVPLALGNIFGADMINMWTISLIALVFGVGRLFGGHGPGTQRLMLVAVVIAALAVGIGATDDVALGRYSVGAIAIAVVYVVGMRLVYNASRKESQSAEESPSSGGSKRSAWLGFGGAALVIAIASPFLAISANGIAEATGMASSFMGVLAVAVVTTLPEASVGVAAARRRAYGLVLGNVYGSCVFNIAIVSFIEPVHATPVLESMASEHFIAGGMAVLLMAMGLLVLRSYRTRTMGWLRGLAPIIAVAYPAGMIWVFIAARA